MDNVHSPTSMSHCPAVGHRFIDLYVFWCSHEQRYVLWWGHGLAEKPGDCLDIPMGPFDGTTQVFETIASLVGEAALLSLQRP